MKGPDDLFDKDSKGAKPLILVRVHTTLYRDTDLIVDYLLPNGKKWIATCDTCTHVHDGDSGRVYGRSLTESKPEDPSMLNIDDRMSYGVEWRFPLIAPIGMGFEVLCPAFCGVEIRVCST